MVLPFVEGCQRRFRLGYPEHGGAFYLSCEPATGNIRRLQGFGVQRSGMDFVMVALVDMCGHGVLGYTYAKYPKP